MPNIFRFCSIHSIHSSFEVYLSNMLGLKKNNITYFVITEHIDGSRFHTVAV